MSTLVELRREARELGLKNYSKLNKSDLEDVIFDAKCDINAENGTDTAFEFETCNDSAEKQTIISTVRGFNFEQYAKFNPASIQNKTLGVTAGQINLVHALDNNYKVSISMDNVKNRYDLSVKIANVYEAIHNGKVAKRSDEEILARVKGYKPTTTVKPATKAQIALIEKIEKRSGLLNTTVLKDIKTASNVITELLKKEAALKASSKSAVVTVQSKLADVSFRTKFTSMMKHIFA